MGNYSSLAVSFAGTSDNGSYDTLTNNYTVIYSSATTIKFTLGVNMTGSSGIYTVWMLRNGTAVALESSSGNLTGEDANLAFSLSDYALLLEAEYSRFVGQILSNPNIVTTGQTNLSFGSTVVAVTEFGAMNLPFTVTSCSGSFAISTFSAQVGSPAGADLQLAISLTISDEASLNGQSLNSDFGILVTSLTPA
jgi:hypothetical protein